MDTPVSGTPQRILRLEGSVTFAGALIVYGFLHGSWLHFAALLLVPDIAIIAYALGPRVGAVAYNAAHTYIGPVLLGAVGLMGQLPSLGPLYLIWIAHIAMDRALGFGLKFSTAFQDTHLGHVGRKS